MVTVVIPTRDRADLLRRTLATVAAQRPAPRVVVVDDGSVDHTGEVLAAHDVTVVRNDGPAWGAARARNAGLERVETELVAFVDSDDLLCPGALAALGAALDADPEAPFAYGSGLAAAETAAGWLPEGVIAPLRSELRDPAASLYVRNYVPSSGALVRVRRVRELGGFDGALTYSEDHDLWLRLAALGAPVHVPEVVVVHRRHPGNRHDLVRASADEAAIAARVAADGGTRAARAGTRLAEQALEELKAGRPLGAAAAWRRLAAGHPPLAVARAAGRHLRRRRAAGRLGSRVLDERPDLRRFLDQAAQRA